MWALYRKEISNYFSSLIGYLAICIFLLSMGLAFWVFPQTSFLEVGFADLNVFFTYSPYFLAVLIPILSMDLFSFEVSNGTLKWLFSKPISNSQLLFSKFFAVLTLSVLSIFPTLLYVVSLHFLTDPIGNIDVPVFVGSYFGLFLQVLTFSSIGVWASLQYKNSILACLTSLILNALFILGFSLLQILIPANSALQTVLEYLAFSTHIEYLSRGVLDTRSVLYFLSITFVFLMLSGFNLEKLKNGPTKSLRLSGISILLFLIALQVFANPYHHRIDFTEEKRYTLSPITQETLNNLPASLEIEVLFESSEHASFRNFFQSIEYILQDFKSYASQPIHVKFSSPFQSDESKSTTEWVEFFHERGMSPVQLNTHEKGEVKQKLILPYAILKMGDETKVVDLMPDRQAFNHQESILKNTETLEYTLTSSLRKMFRPHIPIIAFTEGHGELNSLEVHDAIYSLAPHYQVGFIDLKKVNQEGLDLIDLLIMAKPQEDFSDAEKFKIDYFIRKGGNMVFAIDQLNGDLNALNSQSIQHIIDRKLNLDDLFFTYGFRFNYNLVADFRSSPIPVTSSNNSLSNELDLVPWPFHLLVNSSSKHPVFSKLSPLSLKYTGTIDTIHVPEIKKEIVLRSSEQNRVFNSPVSVSLDVIFDHESLKNHKNTYQILGVLLEGKFKSPFQFRDVPSEISQSFKFQEEANTAKILAIADGDIFRNEINHSDQSTYPLGWDPFTQIQYGNKNLLLNIVDFMLDDASLISLRNKEVYLRPLNAAKIKESRVFWQLTNIALPVGFWILLGLGVNYFRKRKYTKRG